MNTTGGTEKQPDTGRQRNSGPTGGSASFVGGRCSLEGWQRRHGAAIAAMWCAMVLMPGPGHANAKQAGEEILGLFHLLDHLLAWLEAALPWLAAGVVVFVMLVTWLICRARRAAAESQEAQAELEHKLVSLQQRLDDAERELEQYRKGEAQVPPPACGPARVDNSST